MNAPALTLTNENTGLSLRLSGALPSHPAIDCTTQGGPMGDDGSLPDQVKLPAEPSTISQYVRAAITHNTRRAYRQDLQDFARWGGAVPCSPETLAAYLGDRAGRL